VKIIKAVAYARYSSDNQREESITAQLRAIREYAEHEGVTIVKEYIDEARSATTDDRPNFLQMINDISNERIDIDFVYIHKLDRFARNRYDSAIYRQKLNSKDVRLVAVTQPLDDSPESMILEAMLEAMAEYYSKNLGREVMKGMKESAYQGKHTGGIPPLGYDVDPETKKYIINEQEAKAIKIIFNMTAAGNSYTRIIDELNHKGFKTKTGRPFGKNSIHDILRNEKYAGVYVFNRAAHSRAGKRNNHASKDTAEIIRVPGAIPAIISPELWKAVQEKLDTRRQLAPRKRGSTMYILTGKVFCGECEGAYTGLAQTAGRNKTKYNLYACNKRKRTKECNNRDIRKEILENYVLDVIDEAFSSDEKINKLADKLEEYYLGKCKYLLEERTQLIEQIKNITIRMDKLFDAIETGTMQSNVAGPRLNTLAKEKEVFEARLYEIEQSNQVSLDKSKIITHLGMTRQVIANRNDLESCKKIIDMYVEKVTIYNDRIEVLLKIETDAFNTGGGGGSRTPVRKKDQQSLSERSLCFGFRPPVARRQATIALSPISFPF